MALFRTKEIIAASKLPPEGVKLSRMIDAVYFLPIAYLGSIRDLSYALRPVSRGLGFLGRLEGSAVLGNGHTDRRGDVSRCDHVLFLDIL